MKHTKRALALLLALVLALGLAMPAMAAVNWEEFTVAPLKDLLVKRGKSFTLTAQANIPAGVEVTYQWYINGRTLITDATGATMQIDPSSNYYPKKGNPYTLHDGFGSIAGSYDATFECRITAVDSETGETKSASTNQVEVHTEGSFWEKLYSVTFEPLVTVITYTLPSVLLFFMFLPSAFTAYLNNFVGLFQFIFAK